MPQVNEFSWLSTSLFFLFLLICFILNLFYFSHYNNTLSLKINMLSFFHMI